MNDTRCRTKRALLTFGLLLALFMFLSGCDTMPRKPPEVKIPDAALLVQKVRIDPKLLVDCEPELAELKGVQPSDVLEALATSKTIHDVCYKRLNEIIRVVKAAFPQEVSGAATSPSNP